MIRLRQLKLPIDHQNTDLHQAVCTKLKQPHLPLDSVKIFQRAVDAREGKPLMFSYTVDVDLPEREEVSLLDRAKKNPKAQMGPTPDMTYHFLENAFGRLPNRPLIVGTGPAGLFAGLLLAQMGFNPILFERGKMAGPRARDVTNFWRTGEFDPESNVQFGEGGAGTFSDGKLYTQIKDRDNRARKVLEELTAHGAPKDILVNARPHIGTDKLITVLRHLRETILSLGGEIRYESKMTDLRIQDGSMRGITLENGEQIDSDTVILAVGHSARDVFELLIEKKVPIEQKSFSVGVRIEHPQSMVNQTQHGKYANHPRLGSASYRFVYHGQERRSVYSFCMCPGGQVVGASSEPGRLVTNGMSTFARDESNANSGFMVEVHPADLPDDDPLSGVNFQRDLEEKAFKLGGSNYHAPVQLLGDFLKDKKSTEIRSIKPSFRPGVTLADLRQCLPPFVVKALKKAVPRIAKQLPGFDNPDAVLTAVESRSSSPLRVTRGDDLQSTGVQGLYPAGEGAGYAGGIISAAVDGVRVAEAVAMKSRL
ncbi:MAG: putative FAD-dependent dehydrogenase [Verrucomicrobiales bacterium]